MKKERKKWLMGLIFLLGLGIFMYPNLTQIYAKISQYQIILSYNRQQSEMSKEIKKIEMARIAEYNKSLIDNTVVYEDPFETNEAATETLKDKSSEKLGDPIGYIAIPKISVNVPIYNGTTDYILQKGIGLLEKSSMPVGGAGTHAALTGHRGLPESKLFTDLDEMKIGDIFYIHSLAGTLAYEVESVETVLPHETETLKIMDDRDLVTLITCTPYMINTHRILVRGARITLDATKEPEPLTPTQKIITTVDEKGPILIWIFVGGIVILVGSVVIWQRRKKEGEKT
ncbi:class C sortase [Jeotgalibaca porci]|uniref:Class C sortase n=4 Tax=Jeotgalibaca porci TaxID=1868793 RepID=A0A6G7WJ60_9LACT|nr:class C sortase [Jeotgalibaca porci]QIK52305.1 class C sortase [Jeotgalibaca porci]